MLQELSNEQLRARLALTTTMVQMQVNLLIINSPELLDHEPVKALLGLCRIWSKEITDEDLDLAIRLSHDLKEYLNAGKSAS